MRERGGMALAVAVRAAGQLQTGIGSNADLCRLEHAGARAQHAGHPGGRHARALDEVAGAETAQHAVLGRPRTPFKKSFKIRYLQCLFE